MIKPIREGRLRSGGWPYGLRPVVVLGLTAFAAAGVLVLTGSTIRSHTTLTSGLGGDLVFPRWIERLITASLGGCATCITALLVRARNIVFYLHVT